MNSSSPFKIATLVVAVVSLVVGLAIMPAQAHHCRGGHASLPGCGPGGGGSGGGGEPAPQECNLEFQGSFADRRGDAVRSDSLGLYINNVDRVQFTSGTLENQGMLRGMLRFDTNGSARVERRQDIRMATLDFSGPIDDRGDPDKDRKADNVAREVGFRSEAKGIDMRFDSTDGVGLNVCELIPEGDAGHVPGYVVVNIVFLTGDGEDYALSYGCREYPGHDSVDVHASKAEVTRTGDFTWTIEGVSACLRDGPGAYYPRIDLSGDGSFTHARDEILMPFRIELTDLNAP